MDVEVSNSLRANFREKGLTIMSSTKLESFVEKNGKLIVKLEGKTRLSCW